MKTRSKIRCAACKKKISCHEPDLVLREFDTGELRYYHERCSAAAAEKTMERPGVYLLTYRYVDAEAN